MANKHAKQIQKSLAYGLALGMIALLFWIPLQGFLRGTPQQPSHTPAFHDFEGLKGPTLPSKVPEATVTPWQAFEPGDKHHLVIWLTDPNSAWMGLVQGLKSIGVPVRVTQDPAIALQHRVIMVYPTISGRALPKESLQALARHARQGGTLIGFRVEGGGLQSLFGFIDLADSQTQHRVTFDPDHELTREFTHEREKRVPFAAAKQPGTLAPTLSYLGAQQALARYDDGTAAMTAQATESGHAYAIGIDLGALILTGHNNREEGVARAYVNEFEPAIDVWLRLFRKIYEQDEPRAITLSPVPAGRPLSVILSHDVDYTRSIENAPIYAAYEASQSVPATYFIQTKYLKDWNDNLFLNDKGVVHLRELKKMGAEIASHSVAHSQVFNKAELGSGQEQYPDYRPFVHDAARTEGMTVFGELRVSRYLLEHLTPESDIASFRPGHLKNPYTLPQALESSGYRYSSSVTANNSLTHLPFRLTHGREGRALRNVYEFPVTIEDEAQPRLGDRLPQALAVADQLARYGGLMMILIHTDITDHKLAFEKGFVNHMRDKAWFGTLKQFGDFWAARDAIQWRTTEQTNTDWTIALRSPRPIQDLSLALRSGTQVLRVEPAHIQWQQKQQNITFKSLQGDVTLHLQSSP